MFFKKLFKKQDKVSKPTIPIPISISEIETKSSEIKWIHFNTPLKNIFVISEFSDPFTKSKTVQYEFVADYGWDKILTFSDSPDIDLGIGIKSINSILYLTFATHQKYHKFKNNDKILFLFRNEEIKEFSITEKGYKIDKDDQGVLIESKIEIDIDTLTYFSSNRIKMWRLITADNQDIFYTGNLTGKVSLHLYYMFKVYKYLVDNPINS